MCIDLKYTIKLKCPGKCFFCKPQKFKTMKTNNFTILMFFNQLEPQVYKHFTDLYRGSLLLVQSQFPSCFWMSMPVHQYVNLQASAHSYHLALCSCLQQCLHVLEQFLLWLHQSSVDANPPRSNGCLFHLIQVQRVWFNKQNNRLPVPFHSCLPLIKTYIKLFT